MPAMLSRAARISAALLLACAAGMSLAASDIQGVRVDDSVELQGRRLQLNGAGVRYKAIFKVAVVALYLERRASNLDEVLATPGPKRLLVTLLRDMDSEELGRVFARGVEDNLERADRPRLVPSLLRMGQVFSTHKRLAQGDTLVIDWVPGQGTYVTIKNSSIGEPIREPEFFKALMANQVGPTPVDYKLKDKLLGVANAAP